MSRILAIEFLGGSVCCRNIMQLFFVSCTPATHVVTVASLCSTCNVTPKRITDIALALAVVMNLYRVFCLKRNAKTVTYAEAGSPSCYTLYCCG